MITVPEAAKRAGKDPETIRRWIRAGRLRARKIGTQHVIEESDLDVLLEDEVLPVPASWGWDRMPDGRPVPNVVASVKRSRRDRSERATVAPMNSAASRELRNNTRQLLQRAEAGELMTITVDGRAVAVLGPVARRPRWVKRDEFIRGVVSHQADVGLRDDLRRLAPGTTGDTTLR